MPVGVRVGALGRLCAPGAPGPGKGGWRSLTLTIRRDTARATQPPDHMDTLPSRPTTAAARGQMGARGPTWEGPHPSIATWHVGCLGCRSRDGIPIVNAGGGSCHAAPPTALGRFNCWFRPIVNRQCWWQDQCRAQSNATILQHVIGGCWAWGCPVNFTQKHDYFFATHRHGPPRP